MKGVKTGGRVLKLFVRTYGGMLSLERVVECFFASRGIPTLPPLSLSLSRARARRRDHCSGFPSASRSLRRRFYEISLIVGGSFMHSLGFGPMFVLPNGVCILAVFELWTLLK